MSSSQQGFYSKVTVSPKVFRHVMNCWPPFWGLRVHIEEISPDWRYLRARMKLSMRNKNYVGSHFGGGLFAMTDPFYMLMLKNRLGAGYLVWDKAATIEYLRPGRSTVFAEFRVTDEMLAAIYAQTGHGEKFEPVYTVDVLGENGEVVAHVKKTLYVRKPMPQQQKS